MLNITRIHLGSDHAGFDLKESLKEYLDGCGYEVIDHGAHEFEEGDDYPDYIYPAVKAVAQDLQNSRGIIFGGSGQGEAICANRVPGIRAVVFNGQYEPLDDRDVPNEIVLSRQHNDSNVLSLGARFLNFEEAKNAVDLWLETEFSGEERHIRRLDKIDGFGLN